MWEPRRLTTLWAFMACYGDNFTFIWQRRGVWVPEVTGVLFSEKRRPIYELSSERDVRESFAYYSLFISCNLGWH
jgi:hypothetical protein